MGVDEDECQVRIQSGTTTLAQLVSIDLNTIHNGAYMLLAYHGRTGFEMTDNGGQAVCTSLLVRASVENTHTLRPQGSNDIDSWSTLCGAKRGPPFDNQPVYSRMFDKYPV
jgi:hypothetical protein